MLGHVTDAVILVLTGLMCWWNVRTYVLETRGNNTAALAAAKKLARHEQFRRWQEERTLGNLRACLRVKVDPRVYRGM